MLVLPLLEKISMNITFSFLPYHVEPDDSASLIFINCALQTYVDIQRLWSNLVPVLYSVFESFEDNAARE